MAKKKIKTGGGTFIRGDVATSSGDFIGRDKIRQIVINGSVIVAIVAIVAIVILAIVSLYPNTDIRLLWKPISTSDATIASSSSSTTTNHIGGNVIGSNVIQANKISQGNTNTVTEQAVGPKVNSNTPVSNEPLVSSSSTKNIIEGDVISSTVYQAEEIRQRNESTVVSNTLSIQQKMIREAGQTLQEALEADKNVAAAIPQFRDHISKVIAIDPTNEEAIRLLANEALRKASHQLIRIGEHLISTDNYQKAVVYFSNAFALAPPSDALLYVYVPAGEFISNPEDNGFSDGVMGDTVTSFTHGFWIMRTEVTNAEFKECVDAGQCNPPHGIITSEWANEALAKQPVNVMDTDQASEYATWVGGRLPTDDEWEKACRGIDGRTYPWGNEIPSPEYANYMKGVLTDVGSYPKSVSAYGLYDMAGNAWEWVSRDGEGVPLRGGSTNVDEPTLRCSSRATPAAALDFFTFRVVISEPKD